ncbi:hypothetical protein VPH35_018523 [Triticum aestivum]
MEFIFPPVCWNWKKAATAAHSSRNLSFSSTPSLSSAGKKSQNEVPATNSPTTAVATARAHRRAHHPSATQQAPCRAKKAAIGVLLGMATGGRGGDGAHLASL